jgi:SET domain-containing protein
MNRKQILKNLKNDIYCRLKRSPIHGIGVFAIRNIPKGIEPFKGCKVKRWYGFMESELKDLNPSVKKMVHDFFDVQEGKIWIPDFGLNGIDILFFPNHSKKPNLKAMEFKNKFTFITIKEIKAGEELTVDYSTYDERSK